MAKLIKVECPVCRPSLVVEQIGFWPECHRCHGRGYVYQRPPVWRCPICERLTQGLKACGHCRSERRDDQ